MIERFKRVASHSVSRNSFALFVLQIVSMISPLIVLPYLARNLGIEGFGLVMLAMSASAIGLVITDYGFSLSATYTISKARNDVIYISKLIGAILIIKILLSLVFLFVSFLFSYFFSLENKLLFWIIGFNVLSQSLLPIWLFQGIERMKNVTIFMTCAKISYVFMVFAFVDDKSNVELVVLLLALSNLFASLIAIRFIYINGYSIKLPNRLLIKTAFTESSPFFVSRASVAIYTSASTFLVGAFAGVQQAAFYGASEKIYQASQSFTSPLAQALFPYMANNNDNKFLMKVFSFIGVLLIIGCSLVGVWAAELMGFIFGESFYQSGNILQLFLIITIINFISVIFGYPAFAGLEKVEIANYTVILGAFIQLASLVLLYTLDSFSAVHVVISVLLTELVVMLSRIALYAYYK